MNLSGLKTILNTVNIAGIDEVVLEKDNAVVVRGMDKDNTVVVISKVDSEVVDKTIGIYRIPTFIDRLNLFNLDAAKVNVEFRDDYTKSITVTEKNKKVAINFPKPGLIKSPHFNHTVDIRCRVLLNREAIDHIASASSAINASFVTLKGEGTNIVIEFKEGNDVFQDVIGDNTSGEWINNWSVKSFIRLLKQAKKSAETVDMGIDSHGLLYLPVDGIDFMLLPQVVE